MNEIGRRITDKLIEIHGSTDFSIAFLPYKRSMWNSMESVYEECKASGAEVHCMPIPYKCLKENKELDFVTSDFALFGDIAEPIEMLTDVDYIAIHYQYEDHNKVTGMLPQYFTKALKDKYNCKIIFLPYGVGMGSGHFALQPGCRYVDYAFLEDENNAERFIAGWLTQGIDFNGRCFGYGSAKLDAAVKGEKVIPSEWLFHLEDKSVTLVCNSLGPFLTDPITRLNLYQNTIAHELEQGRAVIFRPHPLLRQTIKSMVPDMMELYNSLLLWMSMQRNVVVDESEYLERAIAISNRMISDPSSVLTMYHTTGKPSEVLG